MIQNYITLIYEISLFAIILTITPGPNNIMLIASGTNYGYKRSLPHIIGINSGYNSLLIACGLGLGQIFTLYPQIQTLLKICGSIYLIYLAYRILQATQPKTNNNAKPLKFIEAFAFQYINPKAWIIAITIIAGFINTNSTISHSNQLTTIITTNIIISFISASTWTLFGVIIAQFLKNQKNLRIFNISMASLLILTLYWIIT